MKQLALGAAEYLGGCTVGSDILSQHIYRSVYLSSKGPSDCALNVEQEAEWWRTESRDVCSILK